LGFVERLFHELRCIKARRISGRPTSAKRGNRRAVGDEHATDKRVKFDFEVDFSNGGGLQG
jgi:hypothetical protein